VSFNDLAHLVDAYVRVDAWADAERGLLDLFARADDIGSRRTTNLLVRTLDRIDRPRAPSTLVDAGEALRERLLATADFAR
jgi:hypothetical protein